MTHSRITGRYVKPSDDGWRVLTNEEMDMFGLPRPATEQYRGLDLDRSERDIERGARLTGLYVLLMLALGLGLGALWTVVVS